MKSVDVLCSGSFNIVHAGHVRLFEYASSLGDLTVAINGDRYQKIKYGPLAVPAEHRIYVLEACKYVSQVLVFEENEPSGLILRTKPKVFVRGVDYKGVMLPEKSALDMVGCRLVIHEVPRLGSSRQLCAGFEATMRDLIG